MALTGLDIYKHLPKTNCGKCGSPTCLAFAMRLAAKKASLDECPFVTEEAKAILNEASAPPISTITIGKNDEKIEVGGETVLFRHDKTFYHATGIAVTVKDTDKDIEDKVKRTEKLVFDRVGQIVKTNLICVKNESKNAAKFSEAVNKVQALSKLPLILVGDSLEALDAALKVCGANRPLVACHGADHAKLAELAKKYSCPMVVSAKDLDELAGITQKLTVGGFRDIVINLEVEGISKNVQALTQIRRLAIKKNYRPLGFPVIVFVKSADVYDEVAQAATYIEKYGSLVVVEGEGVAEHLALLTLRQNIYTDPQKPVSVESKIYEIGGTPGPESPLLVTTNFSLTYFTVAPEIEASKVPSWLLVCDAEGMSVLTAWAAEKFTPDSIKVAMDKFGADKVVNHKKLILPGYVAVMKGKLEDALGWEILVGPREATGIPAFIKENWR